MFGGDLRRQRPQQAATADHPLKGQERVLQVQLQTEIGGENKPERHFLLLPGRGHLFGQTRQHLLFEAQLEELLLVGLADDLDLIKLAAPEGRQHSLRMVFDDVKVKHPSRASSPAKPASVVRPSDRPGPALAHAAGPGPHVRADTGDIRRPTCGRGRAALGEPCKGGPCLARCESRRR